MCITLAFALSTCSTNKDAECLDPDYFDFDESLLAELDISFQNVCRCVTDAVINLKSWDILIDGKFIFPDEKTIRSMSTCGLLATFLEFPYHNMKPWCWTCDFFAPGVTIFNAFLQDNKMAVEFFSRRDFYAVLVNKYLSVFNKEKSYQEEGDGTGWRVPVYVGHIEMLLASDMSMSALSDKEKIQLMAMALERTKYGAFDDNNTSCHIMIAIMKSYKYTPFMEDIEPWLVESNFGYTLSMPGEIPYNGFLSHHRDIIIEYANQFLNEQKIITL